MYTRLTLGIAGFSSEGVERRIHTESWTRMGDALLWAVKNGDLVAVKDLAQKKVSRRNANIFVFKTCLSQKTYVGIVP